jgi:hypothetical protein
MHSFHLLTKIGPTSDFFQRRPSYLNKKTGEIEIQEEPITKTEMFATIGGKEYMCTMDYSTGNVIIEPEPQDQAEKIRFAFMGSDSSWLSPDKEPGVDGNVLTSSTGNMRARYKSLKESSQVAIIQSLKVLFEDFMSLSVEGRTLMVQSRLAKDKGQDKISMTEVEIAFTGSAFRKIFTALVLFYAVVEATQKTKIYLIEEPETQLYPSLTSRFINMLVEKAKKEDIQMVITSNAHRVFELFSERVLL